MKAKKLIVALLLLGIVLVVAGLLMIDVIAKAGVERGSYYALEVPTSLDRMGVSLVGGSVNMDGLKVSNPDGFQTPYLMNTGHFGLEVRPGSLLTDTVEISKFELDGLEMYIEQKLDGSNVSKIIDSLKRFNSSPDGEKTDETDGEGKKLKVSRILIKNVTAHFQLLPGISPKPITVNVPQIELTDVSPADSGITVVRLVAKMVPAIVLAVMDQAKGSVPGDFLKTLDSQMAAIKGLSAQVTQVGGQMVKDIQKAAEPAKAAVQDAGKTLKNLLGSEKPKILPAADVPSAK